MSLSVVLSQLLRRSIFNPGKIYSETLDRGLTVAFGTMHNITTLKISRPKPKEPSYLELVTCLKAINVNNPETIPSRKLEDTNNYYLLVDLPNMEVLKDA